MVTHTKLISTFTSSQLKYNHTTSLLRHTRTGVLQGYCISPILSNFSSHHTHTPTTSPPPMQMISQTPIPTQTTLLPPQPSWNKQLKFCSGLRHIDLLSYLLNSQVTHSHQTILLKNTNYPYPPTLKTPPYLGSHPQPSLHLWTTHLQPRLPHHSPPQHFKIAYWHKLVNNMKL